MLVKTFGSAVNGIDALTVTMEVNISSGVKFFIVGLPDNAVKESEHRIESALSESGWRWPGKQIVINMAPADIRKEGSAYDLPLAIAILAANEKISDANLHKYVIMGELSLDGSIMPIRGALPMALKARDEGFEGCIFPKQNVNEAAIVDGIKIFGASNLKEVAEFLDSGSGLTETTVDMKQMFDAVNKVFDADFSDVKGQEQVKRALEIAAAGGHNILLVGSPGSGKSMMAKRLPSILPPLSLNEALETTKIHSVAGKIKGEESLLTKRPFRSPHHTISDVALVGGGNYPQPGEISLAHNGVLFLDELPEFKRTVLEVMRQPLEDRTISISRSKFTVEYPASFMLVASMNPCPCGYYGDPTRSCVCPPGAVKKYLGKISGPLLDRIDLHVVVTPVPFDKLAEATKSDSSEVIRDRVVKARARQSARYDEYPGIHCNAQMTPRMLSMYAQIDEQGLVLLKRAMLKFGLSARAYDRILKVARTIADLDGSDDIKVGHIAEAIQYRSLDRDTWGE